MDEQVTKCRNEVNAALDKYQMMFDFSMVIRAGSVEPVIRLVAKPKENGLTAKEQEKVDKVEAPK